MSTPQLPLPFPSFVDIPTRFSKFNDLFEFFEWQMLCGLRVSCPGIIQSFDPVKQTVTVQLAIRENILQNLVRTPIAIAPLVDVPVVFPRGGKCTLTMPIQQGDECLVVFGDMCIDGWWQSGGIQNQLDKRRHDLSDGFCIPGPWSQTRTLLNYSPNTTQLRSDDGQTIIELDPTGKVNVTASQVNVQGTQVTVSASQNVNVSGNGHTTIEGKDFLTHQHTGVQTGGGVTGPVR